MFIKVCFASKSCFLYFIFFNILKIIIIVFCYTSTVLFALLFPDFECRCCWYFPKRNPIAFFSGEIDTPKEYFDFYVLCLFVPFVLYERSVNRCNTSNFMVRTSPCVLVFSHTLPSNFSFVVIILLIVARMVVMMMMMVMVMLLMMICK